MAALHEESGLPGQLQQIKKAEADFRRNICAEVTRIPSSTDIRILSEEPLCFEINKLGLAGDVSWSPGYYHFGLQKKAICSVIANAANAIAVIRKLWRISGTGTLPELDFRIHPTMRAHISRIASKIDPEMEFQSEKKQEATYDLQL
jgi:hypothetical protein